MLPALSQPAKSGLGRFVIDKNFYPLHMSYSIQAVISTQGSFPAELPDGVVVLQLDCGIQIIPLGSTIRKQYGIPFLPFTDEDAVEIPSVLLDLCLKLGHHGPVAYIEAEIFGGTGMQAHVLISEPNGKHRLAIAEDAINHSLKWLGVRAMDGKDEFATVGLGKHRETDSWLRDGNL